ncbi:cupin domain-containing protein [Salinigranum salinum]|uniref:cupin domain-containing protein n=1 Tax=Salinigranum salinum TaxID=1364937 RepID=UPI001863A867|nr:cupin domain-containing protein [Salinigranum salinum]
MSAERPSVVVRDTDSLPTFGGDGFASRIIADETVGVEHVSVGVVEFDAGARGARHVREVEEIVFVLDGRGRICTDEEVFDLAPGQAAIIPPGVHHYHENVGDSRLRKLWIFAPQGPERAIRDRGSEEP